MSSLQKNTPGGVPGGKSASPTLEVGLPKHTPPGYSSQELAALNRARDPGAALILLNDRIHVVATWQSEFHGVAEDVPTIPHHVVFHLLRTFSYEFADRWLERGLQGADAEKAIEWIGWCLRDIRAVSDGQ